ncbi:hypothetical protein BD779DRAFT_1672453 [Infundibulicybe gibba]|nr:hypothetical protein BD779DRAFT_1672453 [Infundibulicybe gibba]
MLRSPLAPFIEFHKAGLSKIKIIAECLFIVCLPIVPLEQPLKQATQLILVAVAFLPRLVITSPHGPIALWSGPLPLGVNHIAHDERTGNYIAYRDEVYGTLGPSDQAKIHHPSELSKRDTVNCGRLNVVTGWEKIEGYARKRSGLAKLRASTSLGNQEKRGATLCINLYIKHQGTPECHDKVEQHGTVAGTNSMRLRVQSGYTLSGKLVCRVHSRTYGCGSQIYYTPTERAYWGRRAGAKNPVTIHIPKFLDYESVATTMSFSDSYSPQTVFNASRP